MAAVKLYNLARMTSSTAGTGTLTLGSAVAGFLSFANAGVSDGDVVRYAIKDGSSSEIGYGTYTASGTTLTRTVLKSTNSNTLLALSGSEEVFITPAAEDFMQVAGWGLGTVSLPSIFPVGGTNTGIWFANTGAVNIAASGVGRVQIDTAFALTSTATPGWSFGPNGTTNPTLMLDGSVASAATGMAITAAAAGAGVVVAVISSGTNENLRLDAKGSGTVTVNATGTGDITLGRNSNIPLGAVATPSLYFTGDSNTGLWSPAADTVALSTGGSERWRVTSAGKVGVGGTPTGTFLAGAATPQLQVLGASLDTSAAAIAEFSADGNAPRIYLGKSRNATVGSHTIVQSADLLGDIHFAGSDGTNFISAVRIRAGVDGTPGASNDMPGYISIATTPDGSGTLAERFRIDSAGILYVGANSSTNPALKVDGSASSAATGLSVTAAAAASGVALAAISSGTNESFKIDAKGSGNLILQSVATGNVGIGTTNPASKLDLRSSTNILTDVTVGNSAVIAQMGVGTDTSAHFWTSSGWTLKLGVNGASMMTFASNGNAISNVFNTGGSWTVDSLDLTETNFRVGNSGANVALGVSAAGLPHLWTQSSWALVLGTNATERMRIDSSGNVGIGTTGPVNTLDVTGSIGWGAPVTKTADFSLAATENWVINNKSGSTCTATLPAASSWTGRVVTISTIQAQTVVSASSNVVPLAGGAAGTAILAGTAGKWATLVSNGTNWQIMAAN